MAEPRESALLPTLSQYSNQTSLNLGDLFLGNESCKAISTFLLSNPQITFLNLKGNNLSYQGIKNLEPVFYQSKIDSICFQWNNIGASQSTELLAEFMTENTTIKELDLRNNRIGNSGAIALANSLKSMTNLTVLDLRWNQITQEGASVLIAHSRQCGALQKLELAGNPIQTQSIDKLESNSFQNRFSVERKSLNLPSNPNRLFAEKGKSDCSFRVSKSVKPKDELPLRWKHLQEQKLRGIAENRVRKIQEEVKSNYQREIPNVELEVLKLQKENQELKRLIKNPNPQIEQIQKQVQNTVSHKQKVIVKLKKEKEELLGQLSSLQQELISTKQKSKSELENLEARIRNEQQTVGNRDQLFLINQDLSNRNLSLKQRITELEKDLSDLVKDYSQQLIELDLVIQDKDKEISNLKRRRQIKELQAFVLYTQNS